MNYRIFSLLISIIILSHLLLDKIDDIKLQNYKLTSKQSIQSPASPKGKKIKEDIIQYNIENFESDLDFDDELDYDLDLQYKYRDDALKIDVPPMNNLASPNNKNLDRETIENPTLYKWDEQTKSNMYYSEPSAAQGIRTIKPDMYQPTKNEKIINGGFIDKNGGLKAFDGADCGYAAI